MMAPIFKKVAQEMEDKAVFVKIDTNAQYEISSRFQVRSLPTFMWFVGDSRHPSQVEKGGIGEQRLREFTTKAIRQAEYENIVLDWDDFLEYYKEADPNKEEADLESLYQKCAKKNKGSKQCAGAPATQLIRKLKKKYGKAPPKKKRFDAQSDESKEEETKSSSESKSSAESNSRRRASSSGSSKAPNLHLATKEQLQVELEKRLDEERDAEVESEPEDEDEADPTFKRWTPGPFPQPVCIYLPRWHFFPNLWEFFEILTLLCISRLGHYYWWRTGRHVGSNLRGQGRIITISNCANHGWSVARERC